MYAGKQDKGQYFLSTFVQETLIKPLWPYLTPTGPRMGMALTAGPHPLESIQSITDAGRPKSILNSPER